jgi:hypothetical protein
MTGCANLSSFRDVAHVLMFWVQSCLGRAMSAQKQSLKFAKISTVEYIAIFFEQKLRLLRRNEAAPGNLNTSYKIHTLASGS